MAAINRSPPLRYHVVAGACCLPAAEASFAEASVARSDRREGRGSSAQPPEEVDGPDKSSTSIALPCRCGCLLFPAAEASFAEACGDPV